MAQQQQSNGGSQRRRRCPLCDEATCPGPERLREFESWDDLAGHLGEATIVRFVNELARTKERQRFYHKKSQVRVAMLERAAREQLAPDEIAEIRRQAALRAEERMHERREED